MKPDRHTDAKMLSVNLEKIEALSSTLAKANDATDTEGDAYTETMARMIHELAENARVLWDRLEGQEQQEAA
jgi:DNA-binding ferritin-like protein